MDAVHAALRRLRFWFVMWFVVQSATGTVIAVYVVDGLSRHPVLGHLMGGVSIGFTVSAAVVASMLLLGFALLIIDSLLELRPWARIAILVVGWITFVGAVANLFTLPEAAEIFREVLSAGGSDWRMLEAASLLTKTLDLVFWSWVIYTLQISSVVRGGFVGHR